MTCRNGYEVAYLDNLPFFVNSNQRLLGKHCVGWVSIRVNYTVLPADRWCRSLELEVS